MAMSKINEADAQEWLESLSQVGEGWWRGVNVAVRAGAPKALGLTPREFAQKIGQRLIDPRDAIIELYNDQPATRKNVKAIADVLGIATQTVRLALAEAGLIEWTPGLEARKGKGSDVTDSDPMEESDVSDSEVEYEEVDVAALEEEIEALKANRKGDQSLHRREVKELKDQINRYQRELTDALRKARKEAEQKLTEQERARAKKEADAWGQEQTEKIMVGLSFLLVNAVTDSLDEATEGIRAIIRDTGGLHTDALKAIERSHAGFIEELNMARMSERSA